MIAYRTDARLTTVTCREGHVSWRFYNLLLTPAHDWIQDCICNWTREWDPALNMSTVRPNRRQGIIAMLSGGTVGRFCEPIRADPIRAEAKGQKWKHSSGV